jgi:hypothetical protein
MKSKKFQNSQKKSQNWPKFSKKAKKKAKIRLFGQFWLFWPILAFLAGKFWIFWKFLEIFGFFGTSLLFVISEAT